MSSGRIKGSFKWGSLSVNLLAASLSVAAGSASAWNYAYPIPYQIVSDNGLCLANTGDRFNLTLEQCSPSATKQKFYATDAAGYMAFDFEQTLSSGAIASLYLVSGNDLPFGQINPPDYWLSVWQVPPGIPPGVGLPYHSLNLTKVGGTVIGMSQDITQIANEGDPLELNVAQEVVYGAKGAYVSRRVGPGTIPCNNDTFGDPIFGTVKQCYVWSQNNDGAWTTIYPDGGQFRLYGTGTRLIRFGAAGNYNYKYLSTNALQVCNSTTFGGDPMPGTAKTCEMFLPSMNAMVRGNPFVPGAGDMCMTRNGDSPSSKDCDPANTRQQWRLRAALLYGG